MLAIAYSRTDLGDATASYQKNREAAKKAGLFFTRDEVGKLFDIQESDNGEKLILGAKVPGLGYAGVITDADIQGKAREIEAMVRKIEEASRRPYLMSARVPKSKPGLSQVDLDSQAFASTMPSMKLGSSIKNAVKILVRLTKYAYEHEDKQSAKRYLSLASYLSKRADNDKSIIPLLIRVTCEDMIAFRLRRMVPRLGHDPEWLAIIDDTLKQLDKPYDLKTAEKIEHWQAIAYVNALCAEAPSLDYMLHNTDDPPGIRYRRFLPKFREAELSRVHEYFANNVSLLGPDPYNFESQQKVLEFDKKFEDRTGWSYAVVQRETLHMVSVMRKHTSIRNALFQAVEILKRKSDPAIGLPLVGRYRLDVDGNQIRIKHLSKGWIVYSIWGDGVDDGGVPIVNGHGDFVVNLSMATEPEERQQQRPKSP